MKPKHNTTGHYPEYTALSLPEMEEGIRAFWETEDIFKKSVSQRPADNPFIFYEGPPSANGMPGIHHVMGRTIKDLFCRFKTLQGYRVDRKAGWDTHGLPVELNVEKKLGITKNDIGTKISVAEYNQHCREDVWRYTQVWNDLTRLMGYWVDLEHPYVTYEDNYIESLWALLKMLYEKDLLYKGYTIQPYSPAAGTGLSSHELNQPGCYRDVKDQTAVAMFKVVRDEKSAFLFDTPDEDVRILAWTTTPWTLPSNVALAVGEKIKYVKVKTYNRYTGNPISVILALDLFEKYFLTGTEELNGLDEIKADRDFTLDQLTSRFVFLNLNSDLEIRFENELGTIERYKSIPILIKNNPKLFLAQPSERYSVWSYNRGNTYTGLQLKDIEYHQLFETKTKPKGDAFRVILGDFVTTTDGTGVVHISPTHGADDMRVARQQGIVTDFLLVDRQGRFTEDVGEFAGEYVKEDYYTHEEKHKEAEKQGRPHYLNVDIRIVDKLKQENKLFKTEKYEHSYPHCWRTDKSVIYYPLDSWFIRTTAIKDKLIAHNKTINWKPASTGEGRFGQWLENLVDWNLSRSRYWGTPLPIWRSEDGKEEICIGSLEQLKSELSKAIAAGITTPNGNPQNLDITDLHKPHVDEIVLVSPTGQPMYRESDLIDAWFDSGAMPYAQHHWPFKNQDKFPLSGAIPPLSKGEGSGERSEGGLVFPADFIAEGVDQTRGWFFTLHVLGVALFDSVAYKNVVSNGLLLDSKGNKMSKRLGNVEDPFDVLGKYGADATRWYMIRNSDPWDNIKFNRQGIEEVTRAHFGTLYNTYSFFALYANLDNFRVSDTRIPIANRSELDRWILSLLHTLIDEVTSLYNDYEPTRAARAIEHFVDAHLSNWYVRLSRRRFWKGEMSPDKQAAYETLHECLHTVGQLMSPIAPFFSDWLYRSLNEGLTQPSIHLTDLVKSDTTVIDADLEQRMELAQQVSSMILSLRKKVLIKVRQPLHKAMIPVTDPRMKEQLQMVESYILSEVNIKIIEYVTDTAGVVVQKAKPNFRTLGKKAGAKMKQVQHAILQWTQEDIAQFIRDKSYALIVEGETYSLSEEDIEIISEDIPGWLVATEGTLTVALDVHITEELQNEGNAREFVNKIQNLRKDKDYEVLDRISVRVVREATIDAALSQFRDYVANEILATQIEVVDSLLEYDEVEFNDTTLRVHVQLN